MLYLTGDFVSRKQDRGIGFIIAYIEGLNGLNCFPCTYRSLKYQFYYFLYSYFELLILFSGSSLTAMHTLHSCSTSRTDMNKENGTAAKFGEPTVRITRARAKGLSISEGLPPPRPSRKHDQKPTLQQNSKRPASDENKSSISLTSCFQHKKRAVLKDVTNVFCDPHVNCINAVRVQVPLFFSEATIYEFNPY